MHALKKGNSLRTCNGPFSILILGKYLNILLIYFERELIFGFIIVLFGFSMLFYFFAYSIENFSMYYFLFDHVVVINRK